MDKKIVFITGISRGIGLEIAKSFQKDGYFVVGTSRSNFDLNEALSSDQCLHIPLDVTNRDEASACLDNLKDKDKVPNVLINNAGITKDQLFLRMKNEDWDDVINSNLTSVFNISKLFVKSMVKNRSGRIINISSVAGLMGNPGQVNYSSAKAGLSGFTKSLAKEVGSRGITVNSVAPGFIETDMTAYLDDNAKNKLIEDIPLKRLGSVQDISDLVIFLSSEDASYITGQTISVDGGLFMY